MLLLTLRLSTDGLIDGLLRISSKQAYLGQFLSYKNVILFFKWVRILPEIDWHHYQCCFPNKMRYDMIFLVEIDILTARPFCSSGIQREKFLLA